MTRLVSRPSPSSKWSYVFFIDFAGHIEDEASINVLSELTENVVDLKVLGSYPRAVL